MTAAKSIPENADSLSMLRRDIVWLNEVCVEAERQQAGARVQP